MSNRNVAGNVLIAAWVLALSGVAAAQPSPGETAAATQPKAGGAGAAQRERAAKLEEALKPLIAEAVDLDKIEKPKAPAVFSRPHPALRGFGPDMAMDCLNRMMQPFVGGQGAEYRDSYIRWHLMWVVKQASQDDRRRMGSRLVQLINMMPPALNIPGREWLRYEPPEIASRYHSLINSGNIVTGYPPFQRVVGPPESYKYMDADKVAKIKANLEEAETLKGKFKAIVDADAQAFNGRVSNLNYVIRQYRGELIYSLLLTGDPEMARRVATEIERQARAKSGVALDLLAYVYLACFEGALDLYDKDTLKAMSQTIKGAAIAMDGYTSYGGQTRNFADYAFHLIYMLEDGGGFIKPHESQSEEYRRRNASSP